MSRRQGQRWSQQEPEAAAQPAAPAADGESRLQKLKELGELKEQGVLTEEEFAAEKGRILAS